MVTAVAVAFAVVGASSPADAHSCAEPVTVVKGADSQVAIGLTVGETETGDVTLQFADELAVTKVLSRPGWTSEQQGSSVHYVGGPLDADTCASFQVVIRARAAGTFRVRAFQHLADGQTVEHPPDGDIFIQADGSGLAVNHEGPPNPLFEQVVIVTGASGKSHAPLILLALGAIVVVALLILLVPSRKARGPRPHPA